MAARRPAGQYDIKVVTEFSASHQLRFPSGVLEPLHGHNWRIEIVVEAEQLNRMGLVMDFVKLRDLVRDIVKPLEHRHLNDVPSFRDANPSAEHVARHVHHELGRRLASARVRVKSVTCWETSDCAATYHA